MKVYKLIVTSIFSLLFSCSSSENEIAIEDDDPCSDGYIVVDIGQPIKFIDNEGNWANNMIMKI